MKPFQINGSVGPFIITGGTGGSGGGGSSSRKTFKVLQTVTSIATSGVSLFLGDIDLPEQEGEQKIYEFGIGYQYRRETGTTGINPRITLKLLNNDSLESNLALGSQRNSVSRLGTAINGFLQILRTATGYRIWMQGYGRVFDSRSAAGSVSYLNFSSQDVTNAAVSSGRFTINSGTFSGTYPAVVTAAGYIEEVEG